MPRVRYNDWNPAPASLVVVAQANEILDEYAEQGYDLSLRQLYYQFVARDLIPNNQKSYNRLGDIVSRARDAGLIDWERIQDRGRATYAIPHWESGEDFLRTQAYRFNLDRWVGQPRRCQVWVEKEALSNVVARAANRWDVAYFPNKGYVSASSIWASAQMMLDHDDCHDWVILHLGDHDPSGLDMSRDIEERLNTYTRPFRDDQVQPNVEIRRIALNMNQVDEYEPPPNPAKMTDSRFENYRRQHGDESWELDALEPSVIVDLIERHILDVLEDRHLYDERDRRTREIRKQLEQLKLPEDD